MYRIGVLAYQGDAHRHLDVIRRVGAEGVPVRAAEAIDDLDGLIIPGGESTTIGKLLERFGVGSRIQTAARLGMPILGTCAGAILLSKEIVGSDQYRLSLMDTTVHRNAYGRQIESFEAHFAVPGLGIDDAVGVFIRAPVFERTAPTVEVLASFEGSPVLVRQESCVAATFHPELTDDTRIHEYFLSLVAEATTRGAEHRRTPAE